MMGLYGPKTRTAPPIFLFSGKVSKYLKIAGAPKLCPTKNISSPGSPIASAMALTHSSFWGLYEFGIGSAQAYILSFANLPISHGLQPPFGEPSNPCTIKTFFIFLFYHKIFYWF